MTKHILLVIICLCCGMTLTAQNYVSRTFKDTRVINTHSVELVPKNKLDFRVGHRFGDLAGTGGGWNTFYGLETAADVLIGFEYGMSDRLNIGISRTKGSGPLRQLINGLAKVSLLKQSDSGTPVSLTLVGVSTISTMAKTTNPESLNRFENLNQRMVHHAQVLIGRKFSDAFSLQLSGAFTHRNLVDFEDENDIISIGLASRIQVTRVLGLILDASYPLSSIRTADNGYYFPLGVGFEIETGGHVFQINLTNATALVETDYIPYTRTSWGEGQFRLGFTISRLFNIR